MHLLQEGATRRHLPGLMQGETHQPWLSYPRADRGCSCLARDMQWQLVFCRELFSLTGNMNRTEFGGTNRLAPKAVRCWVRHTAWSGLVSSRGTMPSVFHLLSCSQKYWHKEVYRPSVTSTADQLKWFVMLR